MTPPKLHAIPDTLAALSVPVDSIRPYRRNPRRGDVQEIVRSLQAHGQYRPIVVNARTREVLAGNHTLLAALALGWEEIAATFADVDDDQAKRIVLIDNRANDFAGYDDQVLADLLGGLPDLTGTGYGPGFLDDLLERLDGAPAAEAGGEGSRDEPRPPRANPGDIFVLGDHRLRCGDIDLAACDVIVTAWERHTGQKAELAGGAT